MKILKIFVLVIFGLTLNSVLVMADSHENPWTSFISAPNRGNYEKCSNMVHDSINWPYEENDYGEKINTPTQKLLISNYDLFEKFLMLVRDVNPYAVNLAFQLYPLTNGGASEDLFGQISMMVKQKPEFFLFMLKKYRIDRPILVNNFVSSYPVEEFVDNLDKRIMELEKRIEALEKVENPELFSLKDQCVAFLTKDLIRYRRIKNS